MTIRPDDAGVGCECGWPIDSCNPAYLKGGSCDKDRQRGYTTHPADRFTDLKEDWDSYGAKPITPEAIKAAKAVWFVPLPNGGIQVEAHLAGGEIEFEINPDGSLGECLYEPTDQGAEGLVQEAFAILNDPAQPSHSIARQRAKSKLRRALADEGETGI